MTGSEEKQQKAFKSFSVTIELPPNSINPKTYHVLTGRKLPIKHRIKYYIRRMWKRNR